MNSMKMKIMKTQTSEEGDQRMIMKEEATNVGLVVNAIYLILPYTHISRISMIQVLLVAEEVEEGLKRTLVRW